MGKLKTVSVNKKRAEIANYENLLLSDIKKKKKVVVGLSGGVDSSVAAKLLIDDGYEVIGLFMHNWEEDDGMGNCTSIDDWQDAQNVASKLSIPIYSINFSKDYMERVFSYFLAEYKKGRTPNPDVLCNREIKFGPFLEYAKKLQADYIATGHYCGIKHSKNDTQLIKAKDQDKCQTYFLNQVTTGQLSNTLFPLAKLEKRVVREIAKKEGLITAHKKDSTGICFIGERKFREFLKTYLPANKGDIVDTNGKVLGTHDGLMYYTLGQRKGFGVGGVKNESQNRWFVVKKDLEKNHLIVSNGEGKELFSSSLRVDNINFIGKFDQLENNTEFRAMAKCRYRQPDEPCTVIKKSDHYIVNFDTPQRAITPGQFIVFYQKSRCLGGGVIE